MFGDGPKRITLHNVVRFTACVVFLKLCIFLGSFPSVSGTKYSEFDGVRFDLCPVDISLVYRNINYLSCHADMCVLLAELLRLRASGEADAAREKGQELKQFLWDTEMETQAVFDTWIAQTSNGYGRYLQ